MWTYKIFPFVFAEGTYCVLKCVLRSFAIQTNRLVDDTQWVTSVLPSVQSDLVVCEYAHVIAFFFFFIIYFSFYRFLWLKLRTKYDTCRRIYLDLCLSAKLMWKVSIYMGLNCYYLSSNEQFHGISTCMLLLIPTKTNEDCQLCQQSTRVQSVTPVTCNTRDSAC